MDGRDVLPDAGFVAVLITTLMGTFGIAAIAWCWGVVLLPAAAEVVLRRMQWLFRSVRDRTSMTRSRNQVSVCESLFKHRVDPRRLAGHLRSCIAK